jgi:TonB family protein
VISSGIAIAPYPASEETLVEGLLFTLLPPPQSRWRLFVTGWSVQALSLVGLLFVSTRFHQNLIPPEDYRVTNLVSYEPLALHEQQPVIPPVLARSKPPLESKPLLESKPAVAALVVTPQRRALPEHKLQEPDRPAPELNLDSKMPVIPAAPASKIVAVGTFSASSSVTATATTKPAAPVQTGGFGDPNGIPSSEHREVANIRESGSFELAKGSGHGNGIGGTHPGVVMSSGFGNGAIDAHNSASIRAKAGSHQPGNGTNAPVEITFKPKPDYTDEGREQKINGEVRLEVLFRSDGQVHVIRVLQGLGYGLDEQAVKAAEQIKFMPALHGGQPVDSMAMVYIIFELIS